MILRNVTIWTTGLMLIGTIVVPAVVMAGSVYAVHDRFGTMFASWLCSSTPLLVSLVLAIKLQYRISIVILLVSTIAYGTWFAIILFPVCQFILTSGQSGPEGMAFFIVGILSLPVMIPVWITALLLNFYCTTKNPDPGTAASTPSSPAPFDDF